MKNAGLHDAKIGYDLKIILPLIEEPELYKMDKYNSVEFTLNTQAGGAGTEYKYRARVLEGGEEARYIIKWFNDTRKPKWKLK